MAKASKKGKGRGHKISKVKRTNQIKTKLMKQGKLKGKGNRHMSTICRNPKKNPPKPEVPPVEEASDDDMQDMMDKDDIQFLKDSSAARSYKILKRFNFNGREEGPRRKKTKAAGEDSDDEEMEEKYEEQRQDDSENLKPQRELLPIKTKDGIIRRTTTEPVIKLKPEKVVQLIENAGKLEEKEEEEDDIDLGLEEAADSKLDLSQPLTMAKMLALRHEQVSKYRLRIGCLASGVLEDPVNKLGNLKHLLSFLKDKQPTEVALTAPRLAAISLMEVFKDLLPEYQIKNVEEPNVKLKKETLKLRTEENMLLSSYKNFLTHLEKLLGPILKRRGQKNQASPPGVRLAIVAVECMSQLLEARPYFNFSFNLVRLLVPFLNHSMLPVRSTVAKSISQVLKDDKKGEVSFEIVKRINALVRSKKHAVRPECVSVLLTLRIKDVNLDKEKEIEKKHKKLSKKERFLSSSKRDRKRAKRWEELNKELLETKAEENRHTKQRHFTEVTKLVFTIFFRVLKSAPTSALLTATLEGLAKFAHCINVEFYSDLVNVLEGLLKDEDNKISLRHQLLCIKTVFAILSGHGEFLTIDPMRFYAQLYRNLMKIFIGRKQEDLKVALEIMNDAVMRKRKSLSQQRLFAFTKRLCTVALQQQHNGALGCLQLVKSLIEFSRSLDTLLEPDPSVGQGVYMPLVDDPEYCNAKNTAVYELLILRDHYHPLVRDYARHILKRPNIEQETGEIVSGVLPQSIEKMSATELFDEYSPADVQFNPATTAPFHFKPKQRVFFVPSKVKNVKLRYLLEDILDEEESSEGPMRVIGKLVSTLLRPSERDARFILSTLPARSRFTMADVLDPLQESSMDEECILVDDNDKIVGSASKRACHLVKPDGSLLLHRAFSVFAFNAQGQLLVQKRSQFKVTFPSMWANTCCSHPLNVPGEVDGEAGAKVAAKRRLGLELGVPGQVANPARMHFLTKVHYKANSPRTQQQLQGPLWGEHEIDYILILRGLEESHLLPNKNEVAETRFIKRAELTDFLQQHKESLTPWFSLIAHTLLPVWWDHLDNLQSVEQGNSIRRF
ncbi:nucleolar complex protein 3-like isoform X2 [Cloeon dipterum]|uniref:nucleolar complex protein 3-like isoform X2 n=1 Tax=Cloeon dipterum TaxID=197152 RepID=UPI00322052E6